MDELHIFRRQVKELMQHGHQPHTDRFEWMQELGHTELDFREFWDLAHLLKHELVTRLSLSNQKALGTVAGHSRCATTARPPPGH